MDTEDQAEGPVEEQNPEKHNDDKGKTDTAAESPEAESQDEVDNPPESNHPRGPIQYNPCYVALEKLAKTPAHDNQAMEPTEQPAHHTPKENKKTWKERKNLFQRLWRHVSDAGSSPDEETLSWLTKLITDEDWQDRGDTEDADAEKFMEEWSAKVRAWQLTQKSADMLIKGIGNKDSKHKPQMILHKMGKVVEKMYSAHQPIGKGKGDNTAKSYRDTMIKMNREILSVQNRPEFSPMQEAWDKMKGLTPGEALRGQSTDTNERLRIEEAINGAIATLVPAVNMLTKSSITSQIMIILAILAVANGTLLNPGDTMEVAGITAGLHRDETGQRLLSILWEKEAVRVEHDTKRTDFSGFSELEERMETLTRGLDGEYNATVDTSAQLDKMTRRHCDCVLDSNYPSLETNRTWVLPHEESYGEMCSVGRKTPQNLYEVTVRDTEQGPECMISPTKETRTKIAEEYNAPSSDLVATLNRNRMHPCITKGGYNLNKIPRGEVATKKTQTLIECILHCTFSTTCTDWMFHEKTNRCWVLSISRKYQFAETREHGVQIYTGQRSCTPCGLAAKIELPRNNRDMWENMCTLTLDTTEENPLKCPCDATATYRSNLNKLKASVARNNRNNIRKTTHRTVLADLTLAIGTALKGPGNNQAWSRMTKLITHTGSMLTRDPPKILQTLDPSGGLTSLFSKAVKMTITIVNRERKNPKQSAPKPTSKVGRKELRELDSLLAGKLQTNRAIRRGLELLENTLETAGRRKQMAFQGPQREAPGSPATGIPAIEIAADWGGEITRTSLTPIGLGNTTTTATICPVPTTSNENYKEGPALQGELDPTTNNQEAQWKENCLDQITQHSPTLVDCNPGGQPKDWREVLEMRIPTKSGPLTLVRLAPKRPQRTLYIMDCNERLNTISATGVIVALMEAGCQIRTEEGEKIVPRTPKQGTNKASYWILHKTTIEWEYTQEQLADIWHSVLIAISLLIMAAEAVNRATKRCRRNAEPAAANPQQGSPRDARGT